MSGQASRWRRPGLLLLLAIPVLLLPGARLVRSLDPDTVATFEVRPGTFVREVEAFPAQSSVIPHPRALRMPTKRPAQNDRRFKRRV